MKKSIVTALLTLAAAFLLAACSPEDVEPKASEAPAEVPKESQTQQGGNGVQVPNPMVDSTPEEIQSKLDIFITVPEEAQSAKYYIVAETRAQAQFAYQGDEYVLDIERTKDFVTGVYDQFTTEKDMAFEDYPYHISFTEGKNGYSLFYDGLSECTYMIYMPDGASEAKLQFMTECLAPVG